MDGMSLVAVLMLAVSLSLDALGVGISYGLRGIQVPWKARAAICLASMVITGSGVSLGSVLLGTIPFFWAKALGCAMLFLLGVSIIIQGIRKHKDENSFSCDFDRSQKIETPEALYLGVALSVDSFGAGVSSAVTGMNSLLVPVAAGMVQMIFLWSGGFLGKRLKLTRLKNPGAFVYLSGGLLIGLAVLRWFSA